MNVTQLILTNITDIVNTTAANSTEDTGNFLTAILWLFGAIILFVCICAAGFGSSV